MNGQNYHLCIDQKIYSKRGSKFGDLVFPEWKIVFHFHFKHYNLSILMVKWAKKCFHTFVCLKKHQFFILDDASKIGNLRVFLFQNHPLAVQVCNKFTIENFKISIETISFNMCLNITFNMSVFNTYSFKLKLDGL